MECLALTAPTAAAAPIAQLDRAPDYGPGGLRGSNPFERAIHEKADPTAALVPSLPRLLSALDPILRRSFARNAIPRLSPISGLLRVTSQSLRSNLKQGGSQPLS